MVVFAILLASIALMPTEGRERSLMSGSYGRSNGQSGFKRKAENFLNALHSSSRI